jgi:hypothetical protein
MKYRAGFTFIDTCTETVAVNGGTPLVGPIEAVNPAGAFTVKPTDCENPPDAVTDMERVAVPPSGIVVVDGLAVRE